MKINTKQSLKDLDGADLKTNEKGDLLTLGRAVALILVNVQRPVDPMKNYVLSQKFYGDAEVDIDASDLKMVAETVKESSTYNSIVIGQLLVIFDGLKEKKS